MNSVSLSETRAQARSSPFNSLRALVVPATAAVPPVQNHLSPGVSRTCTPGREAALADSRRRSNRTLHTEIR